MDTSYIVTFIGDDRPGLVEQLSAVIERNSGNWHESQLSQLGGKFAGLILVSLPGDSGAQLETELKALSASGLSVRVTPTADSGGAGNGKRVALTVIGPDRQGIVREVSRALSEHQVNVVEMDSAVKSAPMSAEPLFEARIEAEIPAGVSMDQLADELDEIANQMTLDIDIES